jgi:hypothetical protein
MAHDEMWDRAVLLEEYKLCQSVVQHMDTIDSVWETIFLAGSFTAAGFILQNPSLPKLRALFLFSFVALFGLCLFVWRGKQITDIAKKRMSDIEESACLQVQLGNESEPLLRLQKRLDKVDKTRWPPPQFVTLGVIVLAYLVVLLLLAVGVLPA